MFWCYACRVVAFGMNDKSPEILGPNEKTGVQLRKLQNFVVEKAVGGATKASADESFSYLGPIRGGLRRSKWAWGSG